MLGLLKRGHRLQELQIAYILKNTVQVSALHFFVLVFFSIHCVFWDFSFCFSFVCHVVSNILLHHSYEHSFDNSLTMLDSHICAATFVSVTFRDTCCTFSWVMCCHKNLFRTWSSDRSITVLSRTWQPVWLLWPVPFLIVLFIRVHSLSFFLSKSLNGQAKRHASRISNLPHQAEFFHTASPFYISLKEKRKELFCFANSPSHNSAPMNNQTCWEI